MGEPIISYSGIRLKGENPYEWGPRFAFAFREILHQKGLNNGIIVSGRDTRPASILYQYCFHTTLQEYDIFDLGTCPTPTVQFAMKHLGNDVVGGLISTASHNGPEWDGVKPLQANGLCLGKEEIAELKKFAMGYKGGLHRYVNKSRYVGELADKHLEAITKTFPGGFSGLKVAVDTCNGAARRLVPRLLQMYGCEVHQVDKIDKGYGLSRHPEPISRNIPELRAVTIAEGCDIGLAYDSDGDRISVVDEQGRVLNEAYPLAFSLMHALKSGDSVVTNLSSTRMIDDIVEEYNAKLFKTKVGEINVSNGMSAHNANIGGEGSCGGVIYKKICPGRDGLAAAAMILSLVKSKGGTISQIVDEMPKYHLKTDRVELQEPLGDSSFKDLKEKVKNRYNDGQINEEDGLRIDFEDYWICMRRSNTENIIRIIAESRVKKESIEQIEELKSIIKS